MRKALRYACATVAVYALSACSSGGEMSLVSTGKAKKLKGSPYVSLKQGSRAEVVQSGQTPTTGVHGWVSIQASGTQQVTGGGNRAIINRVTK